MRLKDKVAIVTGGGSGFGAGIAERFAQEGAKVVVNDINAEGGARVAKKVGGEFVQADVAKGADWAKLVQAATAKFGRLDIVVNNAGIALPSSLRPDIDDDETFDENWTTTLGVNLTAHARLVRMALPHLLESDAARIVNIASTEAIVTTAGLAAYAATKAGVVGLTKSMAVELGRHGVTANCICPGPIETGMTAAIPDEAKAEYARRQVPLRRYGQPEEVAQMTLSLCLPAASYVNGAILPVDGGMTVRHT